jgi:hypothetical protein
MGWFYGLLVYDYLAIDKQLRLAATQRNSFVKIASSVKRP